ncbi:putative hydro-lyase [uncultured Eubacterium sp.]|uniref:putative hydro-lyase n=1 Tax=uncultured Eubacterium sp. TaxID=165185 RepID=UPI002803B793|nr:putative hydro-lyase [uncultured Eubacterium sp.]
MDYSAMHPQEVKKLIREGKIDFQTSGMCAGYAQANLCILPKDCAFDFLLFCMRNPKPCPILEVGDVGSREFKAMASEGDVCTDFPKYRIWKNGVLEKEVTDISEYWQDDFVYFLIGCSFSFESEMLEADIPVRHIEENVNVPMFNTNIELASAGAFHGNMVVSMRPIPNDLVVKAVEVTAAMPKVHGAPIQIGNPEAIGILDVNHPDYGDSVTINEGEVPVFWPCGVTPQNAVMQTKPPIAITHAPGHMFITDVKNVALKY